jgi:hypothetical protein
VVSFAPIGLPISSVELKFDFLFKMRLGRYSPSEELDLDLDLRLSIFIKIN